MVFLSDSQKASAERSGSILHDQTEGVDQQQGPKTPREKLQFLCAELDAKNCSDSEPFDPDVARLVDELNAYDRVTQLNLYSSGKEYLVKAKAQVSSFLNNSSKAPRCKELVTKINKIIPLVEKSEPLEKERLEKERLEREPLEKERLEKERLGKERTGVLAAMTRTLKDYNLRHKSKSQKELQKYYEMETYKKSFEEIDVNDSTIRAQFEEMREGFVQAARKRTRWSLGGQTSTMKVFNSVMKVFNEPSTKNKLDRGS